MLDRILQLILNSKTFQKFGVGAGLAILILYILDRKTSLKYSITVPVLVGIVLLILAYNVFIKGVSKRKASSFEKGLTHDANSSAAGSKVSARKAQKEMVDRWNSAVGELKHAGMSLYDIPWYLLIGEPQSGKSTTLKKSGLEFPVGTEALSGAGGTRNCDWWFTNDAVILDTAGRFAFQEKDAPDAAEWKNFLGLLRKRRPRCPMNGVLLVIPCTSLLGDPPEVRDQKAINIREKLTELQRVLGIQFPVFVLITKSDQMLGFTEFFSRVPAQDQHQMLGWSMHGPFIQSFDPEKFNGIFDTVTEQVHRTRLKILSEDLGLPEVDKLFVFPEELKLLREPLREYLRTIFMKNTYLPALFFRGFYFTSGLQEGKPIAKACAAWLGEGAGGSGGMMGELIDSFKSSKVFFIRDFYVEKLFPERNLIVHSAKQSRLDRRVAVAAIALSLATILVTGYFCFRNLSRLNAGIGQVKELSEIVSYRFIKSIPGKDTSVLKVDTSAVEANLKKPVYSDDLKIADAFKENYSKPDVLTQLSDEVVQQDLRRMNWMFLVNNVVQKQFAENQLKAIHGHQNAKPPVVNNEDYKQFRALWSANHPWLQELAYAKLSDHFSGNVEPALDSVISADQSTTATGGSAGNPIGGALQTAKALIKEDLGYKQQPLPALWLPLTPEDNGVLKTAVDQAMGNSAQLTAADISSLLSGFDGYTARIQSGLDQLGRTEFGCFGADSGGLKTQLQGLVASINDLDKSLNDPTMRSKLISLTSTNDSQMKEDLWGRVAWARANDKTEPQKNLTAYVEGKISTENNNRKTNADRASTQLQNSTLKNYVDMTSYTVRAELKKLGEGIGTLVDLVDAENATLDAIPKSGVAEDKIEKLVAEWQGHKLHIAAEAWAGQNDPGSAAGANPKAMATPVPEHITVAEAPATVARIIKTALPRSDESIKVKGWAAWAEDEYDKNRYTKSFGDDGLAGMKQHPPQIGDVTDKNDALEKASQKFQDKLKELSCPENTSVRNSKVDAFGDLRKKNQSTFDRYWVDAYEAWHPLDWLGAVRDWNGLKDKSTPGAVALANLSVDVKSVAPLLLANLKDKSRAASLQGLDQLVDGFVKSVNNLDTDKNKAAGQYKDKTYSEPIVSLGNLPKFSEATDPQKGIARLLGNPEELFNNSLAAFLKAWKPKFGSNNFPFADKKGWASKPSQKDIEVALNLASADPEDLKAFLVGAPGAARTGDPDVDIQSIKDALASSYFKGWHDPGDGQAKKFLEECGRLSSFLLEKGEYRTLELNLDLPYVEKEIQSITGKQPYTLKWKMKDEDKSLVNWVVRTEKSADTHRKIQLPLPLGKALEMVYDYPDSNSELRTLRILPNFSFLAQIWEQGQLNGNDFGNVKFPVPRIDSDTSFLTFHVGLGGTQPIPSRPDWNDVMKFINSR